MDKITPDDFKVRTDTAVGKVLDKSLGELLKSADHCRMQIATYESLLDNERFKLSNIIKDLVSYNVVERYNRKAVKLAGEFLSTVSASEND